MFRKVTMVVVVALALGLFAGQAAAGPITLDDFNNNTILDVNGAAPTSASLLVPGSGAAGSRLYTIDILSGPNPNTGASLSTFTGGGTLDFSIDANKTASFSIEYGTTGPLNLNLSTEQAFVISARADGMVDAEIEVDGDVVAFIIPALPSGVFQQFVFSFALFPNLNPADVDSIAIRIAPGAGGTEFDGQLAQFETQAIPEPTTMLLWTAGGLALGGMHLIRRRRSLR